MTINRSRPMEAFWTRKSVRVHVITFVQSVAIAASVIFVAMLILGIF